MNQLTIDGPKKLLSSIPVILKSKPVNQMVICGLQGEECKFSFHLTSQLPSQSSLTSQYFEELNSKFVLNATNSIVLILYIEENPENYQKISKILFEKLSKTVQVKDLLWVKDHKWASFLCEDLNCCPKEGNSIEIESTTRSSDKINTDFLKINASDQKLNKSAVRAIKIKSLIKDNLKLQNWQKMHFICLSANNSVTSTRKNNWARLLVGLTDIPVRDALLSHFIEVGFSKRDSSKYLIGLAKIWAKVGSFADPQFQSPIFACVSAYLWQANEFEAAKIAVKLSLAADANFRLAHLLQNALDCGVPASEFRDVFKNPAHPWT
ncbi:MAG: hypothetical protein RLZZ37_1067 [Actinomycetota bacterium]